jgi:hypothetical protein
MTRRGRHFMIERERYVFAFYANYFIMTHINY